MDSVNHIVRVIRASISSSKKMVMSMTEPCWYCHDDPRVECGVCYEPFYSDDEQDELLPDWTAERT